MSKLKNRVSTTESGTAFEQQLSRHYESLGYRVTRNEIRSGQEVDLIASKDVPGAGVVKVLIEAKYRSKGAVGINEISKSLNAAQLLLNSQAVSSAVIVTNTAFTADAKSAAVRLANVQLITLHDLQQQLAYPKSGKEAQGNRSRENPSLKFEESPTKGVNSDFNDVTELQAQWIRVSDRIRKEIGDTAFKTWFGEVELGEFEAGKIRLYAPTRFVRDWVDRHYGSRVLAYWQAFNSTVSDIEVSRASSASHEYSDPHLAAIESGEGDEWEELRAFCDSVVSDMQSTLGAPEEHLQYIRAKLREALR